MYDPAIKLFGKTIPLPDPQIPPPLDDDDDKDACNEPTKLEAGDSLQEEPCKPDKSSAVDNGKEDNDQTSSQENRAIVDDKDEKDELKTDSDGQEKVLKKPDKIIPCPRCNSLETKFCYYNNYNVNQPRHFCKNCQRYWTAGGTMRNVPVGAGRRKNKHIASQYRQIMMLSDGIPTTQVDTLDSANHQVNASSGLSTPLGTCNGNGTVLKFCSDAPICESMTSVLNIDDQKRKIETGVVCGGNGEEPSSCGSFVSPSACSKIELPESTAQMEQHGLSGCSDGPNPPPPNPLQCYPGLPWIYPWNSGWNSVAAMTAGRCSSEMFYRMNTGNLKQVQWGPTSMVVAPTFCSPSMPFPFVPAAYWGCMSSNWAAGAWNVPWNGSNGAQSQSSFSSKSVCSSDGSPTLGKHSRDANVLKEGEDKTEKCLWAPKTLRIDDPDEAAKSSIWATLGIKPGQSEPILKGGIFKAFQHKSEVTDSISDSTQILQANPAAFSRSQTFQESA